MKRLIDVTVTIGLIVFYILLLEMIQSSPTIIKWTDKIILFDYLCIFGIGGFIGKLHSALVK